MLLKETEINQARLKRFERNMIAEHSRIKKVRYFFKY